MLNKMNKKDVICIILFFVLLLLLLKKFNAIEFFDASEFDNFDAVVYNDNSDRTYFFKDKRCWEKKNGKKVESSNLIEEEWKFSKNDKKKKINKNGKKISFDNVKQFNNFNTVVYSTDSNTYWFFKNEYCWSKKYGKTVKGPFLVEDEWKNLPTSGLKASCFDKQNNIYFFFDKNNFYVKKSGSKYSVEKVGSIAETWNGIPYSLRLKFNDVICITASKSASSSSNILGKSLNKITGAFKITKKAKCYTSIFYFFCDDYVQSAWMSDNNSATFWDSKNALTKKK